MIREAFVSDRLLVFTEIISLSVLANNHNNATMFDHDDDVEEKRPEGLPVF